MVKNRPVIREDVKVAEDIFGPNVANLKGETVRSKTDQVRVCTVLIPLIIMKRLLEHNHGKGHYVFK